MCLQFQITNRVASVNLISVGANTNGGVDILASVLDASGAPVTGRPLSCWVRSVCGLVQDMIPGWLDTLGWIKTANRLQVGPGGSPSPLSALSLPSYCRDAGYPSYVRFFCPSFLYTSHLVFTAGL
jgi:hypothetical protein